MNIRKKETEKLEGMKRRDQNLQNETMESKLKSMKKRKMITKPGCDTRSLLQSTQ